MPLYDSPWVQFGAVGVVALFVLAILTGRIVARSSVRDLLDQADKRVELAERNAERQTAIAEASDKRADLLASQLGEMVAALRAVEALVRAAPPRKDAA